VFKSGHTLLRRTGTHHAASARTFWEAALRGPPTSDATTANLTDDMFDNLSDQAVLRLYENIRHQVAADKALGGRYRLLGKSASERAERLGRELTGRGVKFTTIDW
jgi:hypothetical protein